MSAISKGSGSEDEPLVPDDFDEDFYKSLLERVPEITKALRQKDTHENADNVQRLVICSNRYKLDLQTERTRCLELNEEIARIQERLTSTEQRNQLDKDTICELRKTIESAWKQKDAAQTREQVVQEEMITLREKLEVAQDTVQRLSDKSLVLQGKRDDTKERENWNSEIRDLNKRLHIQRMYTNEVEAMTRTLEEKNKELLKLLDENSSESYGNKKQMDELQKELQQMKTDEVKYNELIAQTRSQNDQLTKVKVRQNLQILSLKTNLEHLNSQYNANCNKLAKIAVDLEYAVQDRDRYKRELTQRSNLLKVREDELIKMKQENSKLLKSQEQFARKYSNLKEVKADAEEENIRLKTQMVTQDKELEAIRRVLHHFEKNNNNLVKERDVLKRNLLMEHQTAEETDEQFQESRHEIKSLKDTIHIMDMKHKKLREDFNKLKKEKLKKVDEIQTWIDKIDTLQNEIHLKENCEIELKRTISDMEVKCSKFQAQHDGLVNEKSSLQRNIQTLDDETVKLKQQLDNLQHVIETLKGKVSYRDGEISKLQLQIDRIEKERRMLRTAIRKSQLGHQHTRTELLEKKKENNRYAKSLQDDEQQLGRLKKDLDNIMDGKNTISAALTKRNEEYAKLKDDLENLHTAYDQTDKQFSQCQEDMRIMRIEIKNLRTERNVLRKDREHAADLRQELLQMHRVLNQERIKARALQDEMLTPMNIHRWRNLSGKDPEKMDLIHKIQALRKQILNYNVAALEQERALDESQRLYIALKEFMLKLPSYKVKEELNEVKATLSSKQRKLKALVAELNTRETDEKTNKQKFEELRGHLASAKTQLLQEKKKKQKLLEERQVFIQMQAQCFSAPPNMQRTLGAGFKIVGQF